MHRVLPYSSLATSLEVAKAATRADWAAKVLPMLEAGATMPTTAAGVQFRVAWAVSDGDGQHYSLLHTAVDQGDERVCAVLLALQPSLVTALDSLGRSPFDVAVHTWPQRGALHELLRPSTHPLPEVGDPATTTRALLLCALSIANGEVTAADTFLVDRVALSASVDWSKRDELVALSTSPRRFDDAFVSWQRESRAALWASVTSCVVEGVGTRSWGDAGGTSYPEWAKIDTGAAVGEKEAIVNLKKWADVCFTAVALTRDGAHHGLVLMDAQPAPRPPLPSSSSSLSKDSLRFIVIGDWGDENGSGLKNLAKAIKAYAETSPPDMILTLGDHYYPRGLTSMRDKRMLAMWRDQFARRRAGSNVLANVPWRGVIGNHDFIGDYMAQVDYTDFAGNYDAAWQMKGDDPSTPPSTDYNFAVFGKGFRVDVVAFSSMAAQHSSSRRDPDVFTKFRNVGMPRIRTALTESIAREEVSVAAGEGPTWRIAMAHHPMFTNSTGHVDEGKCLRDAEYTTLRGQVYKGFGLESLFNECDVDMYLTGHEHVLQHTLRNGKTQHAVCGACVEHHYYKYELPPDQRQTDVAYREVGFCVVTADKESLTCEFVDVATLRVIHRTVTRKSGGAA